MTESSQQSEKIRTFFALRLRDPIARQLANYADSLAHYDKNLEVQWIDSDNYHLTLCFLGELSFEQVEKVTVCAKKYLSSEQSLNVHLEAIESYQSLSNWTLLVARTSANPQLDALHSLVSTFVEQSGIVLDQQGYKPHITLGRLPANNSFIKPESWPELNLYNLADAVVLYQSKVGERGSSYTPLFTVELKDLA